MKKEPSQNKELFALTLKKESQIQSIDMKGGLTLKLESGDTLALSDDHDQDCCENVYADFSSVASDYHCLLGQKLSKFKIKKVENMGFLLCFLFGEYEKKIFVACYNEQNGYYSSDLDLIVTYQDKKTVLDISDCSEYTDR